MKTLRLFAPCALLLVASWSEAFALDMSPGDIRGKSSKEPVAVLQNRYFLKAYRPEFGLTGGFLLDEAYTNTIVYGVRGGLFLNEWLGFEVEQLQSKVSDSTDRKALNTLKYSPLHSANATPTTANGTQTTTETVVSPDPEVNAIHQITDFCAEAAPFYGKLNILNKWIIYTDIYATGGLSRVVTDQGAKTAEIIGAGERFYIGQTWSFRVNFKDRIFGETRAGQASTRNSKAVDFGGSYFFN